MDEFLRWVSQVAQWQRIHLAMQKMQLQSLGWEEPLEKEMATHSSILAWEIPRTEEPSGRQSMGSQTHREDLLTTNNKQQSLRLFVLIRSYTNVCTD